MVRKTGNIGSRGLCGLPGLCECRPGVQSEVWLEKTGGFNQIEAFGRYPVMPEEAIFIIGRLVVVRWKLD